MARYQVILAYDGTHYHGFQRQIRDKDGARVITVQSVVEDALRKLDWHGHSILAAGRTDAGVHASGQVIAFDLDWKPSPDELRAALNVNLPRDVAAKSVRSVNPTFHPRYDAVARHYRYTVYCQDVRDPLRERYKWHVWPPVDLDVLNEAACYLVGTQDFSAFGTPPKIGGGSVRTVIDAGWHSGSQVVSSNGQSELVFDIVANAFLYRMVRRVVYIQVIVGQGKLKMEEFVNYLTSPPDTVVQGLAPPQGLTLVNVEY